MNSWLIRISRERVSPGTLLQAAMAVLFVFFVARGIGIYPVVFADEWSYSSYSRLLPLSQAGVPSFVYLLLYRATSFCGNGFLDCARVMNCGFMVLAMPFIYKVARQVCSPRLACFVAILSVAGPINTYAIYFMPEAMYFMAFWVLTWIATTKRDWPPVLFGAAVGLAAGLLSLVKVHGLFLVPALVLYGAAVPFLERRAGAPRQAVQAAVVIGIAFLATKFLLGYLLAGRNGLSVLGSLYGSQASGSARAAHASELAARALSSIAGHLMALAILFSVPLACFASGPLRKMPPNASVDRGTGIRVYTVLILGSLLAVVAVFTATAEGSGPLETAGRLHMRYYNFALPLLLIVAGSEFGRDGHSARPGTVRAIATALVAVVAAYATFELPRSYFPSMVDSPELRGATIDSSVFLTIGVISVLATFAWFARPYWGAGLFLFVLAPLIALGGTLRVGDEVRARLTPDVYEDASLFARRYLGPEVSHLVVVAPHPAPLLRALFHLDNVHVVAQQQPEGTRLALDRLPAGTQWLLMIGEYDLSEDLRSTLTFGKYSLLQVTHEREISFKQDHWPSIVHTTGLSAPEAWGTWSVGREVAIEFATTLPREFKLQLVGHGFKTNTAFQVHVGPASKEFGLPNEDDGTSSAVFQTNGDERIIRISIPRPVSPRDLGLGDDARQLGLGLRSLQITTIDSGRRPH
jgi:phosphoglycerol transferase